MTDLTSLRPRRILACQLRQIGDVVLATPSFELIRRRFPEAELHVLTEKKCAPVLENNPNISRVWAIDKAALKDPRRAVAFYREVGRHGFDLMVDFQQLPRCRWVILFGDIPVRLSFTPPWYNRPFYTHWIDMIGGYAAMSKASVLRPLGIEWRGEKPRLHLTGAERDWAGSYLAGRGLAPGEKLVTLDPTHRRATRRWPAGHFGRLLALARTALPGVKFLLLCGPGEEGVLEEVLAAAGRPDNAILPERVLTLREMAAVIGAADLHLGNCSAPRHFAVGLDTPSLVVLGSTGGAWTYPGPGHEHMTPPGLACWPCNKDHACPRGDLYCLTAQTPEAVLMRVKDRLAEPR